MTRFLLAAAVAGTLAAAAPAQFMPGRQNYNFGYAPAGFGNGVGFNYGGFNFAYFQTRQFSYAYSNPFLGYSGAVDLRFNYYGVTPPFGYGGAAVNPYTQAYMYGGAGGYNPGANPIIQEQQRLLAGGRADNGRGDANRLIADQAQMEFGRAVPRPAAVPTGAALDPALLDPPDAAVMAGDTLNALHAAIRPLMEKRKGEPPLFPAEVLGHLRFDGPAAADVLALLRAGKLVFPPPLDGPAFERMRADVEKPVAELVDAAAAGRKSDAGAADRLALAVKKGRADHVDALRGLGVTDALTVSRFFTTLDRLADAGRDGGLTGFYPAKWAAGATAAELLAQMDRLKLTFAPAGPGDDDAYAAAHRGLVTYYMSLAAPRR